MAIKATLAASVQKKNGRLHAVIQVKEDGKTKSVWRALGLPEGASQTLVNKAFRKVVTAYEEEYNKRIARGGDTAVIVYTESLNGLMFGDFTHVWTRAPEGHPHFAIIGMHNEKCLFETTGMNAYGKMPVPALLYLAGKDNHWTSLMDIIYRHIKK